MATAVEEVAQEVLDAADSVLEEASEAVDAAREWNGRDVGLGIIFGLGTGIAVGAFGSVWILGKRLKTKYEELAEAEIADMRTYYNKKLRSLELQGEKKTLDEVSKDLGYAIEGRDGGGQVPYHKVGSEPDKPEEPGDEEAPIVENVFVNNGDDPEVEMEEAWDYDAEAAKRAPEVPYVIHRDEYNETPDGYDQYTLAYFEGDDVLCKEDDSVVEDQDEVIGLGNLSRFGHGSGDRNIVYIRNEKLKVDLEVVHSDGKYAQQVHGFSEDELQHSSMRRRLPRRSEIDDSDR